MFPNISNHLIKRVQQISNRADKRRVQNLQVHHRQAIKALTSTWLKLSLIPVQKSNKSLKSRRKAFRQRSRLNSKLLNRKSLGSLLLTKITSQVSLQPNHMSSTNVTNLLMTKSKNLKLFIAENVALAARLRQALHLHHLLNRAAKDKTKTLKVLSEKKRNSTKRLIRAFSQNDL